MWEKPNCNNCDKKTFKVFLENITIWEYPGKFRIVECIDCHLRYLSPRPIRENIDKYYSSESYWGSDLSSLDDNWRKTKLLREKLYGKIYKEIFNNCKKGCIFDVGAGTGIFLTKFKDLGWEVGGNELSSDAVSYARKVHKINLKKGDFNTSNIINKRYDVVTFNSSLEHLYDPKMALNKAFKMLKKEGLIVITVPNIESLGELILRKNWWPLHPPKHLYHFSPKVLSNMIIDAGFRINKISHWYFHHGYYGIFESLRYKMSPKFSKNEGGGILQKTKNINKSKKLLVKKKLGKIGVSIVSYVIPAVGAVIRKGETITIYAKKA